MAMDEIGPPHWVLMMIAVLSVFLVILFFLLETGLFMASVMFIYFSLLLIFIVVSRRVTVGNYQKEWSP